MACESGVCKCVEAPVEVEPRELFRDQCSVLRHLLDASQGALVLWDPEGRLVWLSSEARTSLGGESLGLALEHAAVLAQEELRRDNAPLRGSEPSPPLRSALGTALWAEFSPVLAPGGRAWLVARLRSHTAVHDKLRSLTRSEARVLSFLVRGLSNREIGAELGISSETVKTHVSRILSKLEVRSRFKIAAFVANAPARAVRFLLTV